MLRPRVKLMMLLNVMMKLKPSLRREMQCQVMNLRTLRTKRYSSGLNKRREPRQLTLVYSMAKVRKNYQSNLNVPRQKLNKLLRIGSRPIPGLGGGLKGNRGSALRMNMSLTCSGESEGYIMHRVQNHTRNSRPFGKRLILPYKVLLRTLQCSLPLSSVKKLPEGNYYL